VGSDPRSRSTVAYIGIGSNLSGPEEQVRRAFRELGHIRESRLRGCSPLYRTQPVGPKDQPDYVNAAACLETRLSARELLDELHGIERRQGRVRDGSRWGPRTLDLDLLLFGGASIDEPGLRVPHPEIANRPFVLVPLADVAPADLSIPSRGTLADLLARGARTGIVRLDGRAAAGCGSAGHLAESAQPRQE